MVLLNTYLILCNAKCNANGFKYKKSPLNKGKKRSARRGSNPIIQNQQNSFIYRNPFIYRQCSVLHNCD